MSLSGLYIETSRDWKRPVEKKRDFREREREQLGTSRDQERERDLLSTVETRREQQNLFLIIPFRSKLGNPLQRENV